MQLISQPSSSNDRLVFLDTETTGLSPNAGHRIVEIGALELVKRTATGQTFQRYLNPERSSDLRAFEVHGLSDEFLSQQAKFADIAETFLEFVRDATLVIHNASFDLGFINAELKRMGKPELNNEYCIDTINLARGIVPGLRSYTLDALCDHFQIKRHHRTLHGALLDTELLVEMYLRMTRRQAGLELDSFDSLHFANQLPAEKTLHSITIAPLLVNDTAHKNHQKMLNSLEALQKPHFWKSESSS